jgi:hypothetical protein
MNPPLEQLSYGLCRADVHAWRIPSELHGGIFDVCKVSHIYCLSQSSCKVTQAGLGGCG